MERIVPNTNGRYKASDDGRIFGPSGIELKQRTDKWGYKIVTLHNVDGREAVCRFVHRLVALAFIPNQDESKSQINHKDEDPGNNNIDNLEWCTHLYNQRYGTRIERGAKARSKRIARYDCEGNIIAIYPSATEAARILGFAQSYIWEGVHTGKIVYGSRWAFHPYTP